MKKVITILMILSIFFMFDMRTYGAETEYLSDDIVAYTEEIGEIYDIRPEFIQAIIEKESSGDPEAFSGTCIGLMQIYPKYHGDRMEKLDVTDLYDPYSNVLVGADYLAELFDKYEDPYLVLMCYNMGEYKAVRQYESGNYTKYAVSVCDRSAELERLHDKNKDLVR